MSVAQLVPETWELTGDDARQTLAHTGRKRLLVDAWIRLRAADGFSHARSLAFVLSLLMVQGVIVLVGLAAALGQSDVSATIVRAVTSAAPGPAGEVLTHTVFHAYRTGASGQYAALVLVAIAALVTGTTLMGQMERALNRFYGIEQDRPTTRKYSRALVLALTAGVLAVAAFVMFALGHAIGVGIGNETARTVWRLARWPLALVLMVASIALLFRCSPRRRQPAWSWLAFGATVSVGLWSVATLGLGWFFQASTTFGRTYGPLAGMMALLLWAFLSSVAILYGAALAAQLEAVRAGAPQPRDDTKMADARGGLAAAAVVRAPAGTSALADAVRSDTGSIMVRRPVDRA
jgi:YihY family inner membrane protein